MIGEISYRILVSYSSSWVGIHHKRKFLVTVCVGVVVDSFVSLNHPLHMCVEWLGEIGLVCLSVKICKWCSYVNMYIFLCMFALSKCNGVVSSADEKEHSSQLEEFKNA